MWMLSFIPDSLLHLVVLLILLAGGVIYFLSMFTGLIKVLVPYKEPMRILGTVLLIAGVYFYGSYDTEMSWRKRVAEAEAKVAKAEAASADANSTLIQVRKQKQKVVKEYYATIKTEIKEVEKQIDVECKLDPVVPKILNEAATNPLRKGNVTVGPIESGDKTK
jgi:hypothetical protein